MGFSFFTRRELVWALVCLLVILRIAYLAALQHETGRGQALAAIALWVGLFAAPIVLLLLRQVRWQAWLLLQLLTVLALPISSLVEPALRSMARQNDDRKAARDSIRYRERIADHEAQLRAAFASTQRVRIVDHGHVILEDGYALLPPSIDVPEPERDRYYAALAAALTGQQVAVTLDSGFATRYIPGGISGITEQYRFGRGARFGEIPATLRWNGRELVAWKENALVWSER